ncbi:MAG: hypothetical protein FJX77_11890, partial [Armatimonadetes bacterium]|nr:hypothetical protein [Armatimonadota bacterium]
MRNELTDRRELLSLAAGLALPRLVQAAPESPPRVEVVRVPHGGIQPQAVADPRGWVHLLYFLGDPSAGDLFYTRRPSGSPTWTAPLRVNRQPGCAVAVGSIRGGQLALGRRGQVHVVWNGSQAAAEKGPDGSAPVLYSRLLAAGRAFEPERNLMRRSRLLDGGASLAADGEGRVVIAWQAAPLVGSQAGGGAGAHRHGAGDGSASRRLFLTRSDDDGGAWSPEQPVDEPPLGA